MKSCWNLKLSKLAVCISVLIAHTASPGQFSETDSATSATPREQERYIFPYPSGVNRLTRGHNGRTTKHTLSLGYRHPVPTMRLAGLCWQQKRLHFPRRCKPGGLWNVLCITHPDGNTTVYGHLDKFKGRCWWLCFKGTLSQKTIIGWFRILT